MEDEEITGVHSRASSRFPGAMIHTSEPCGRPPPSHPVTKKHSSGDSRHTGIQSVTQCKEVSQIPDYFGLSFI